MTDRATSRSADAAVRPDCPSVVVLGLDSRLSRDIRFCKASMPGGAADGAQLATWASATALVSGGAAATVLGALLLARGSARAMQDNRGQLRQYGSAAKRPVLQVRRTVEGQEKADEERQKRIEVIREVRANAQQESVENENAPTVKR